MYCKVDGIRSTKTESFVYSELSIFQEGRKEGRKTPYLACDWCTGKEVQIWQIEKDGFYLLHPVKHNQFTFYA